MRALSNPYSQNVKNRLSCALEGIRSLLNWMFTRPSERGLATRDRGCGPGGGSHGRRPSAISSSSGGAAVILISPITILAGMPALLLLISSGCVLLDCWSFHGAWQNLATGFPAALAIACSGLPPVLHANGWPKTAAGSS